MRHFHFLGTGAQDPPYCGRHSLPPTKSSGCASLSLLQNSSHRRKTTENVLWSRASVCLCVCLSAAVLSDIRTDFCSFILTDTFVNTISIEKSKQSVPGEIVDGFQGSMCQHPPSMRYICDRKLQVRYKISRTTCLYRINEWIDGRYIASCGSDRRIP